MLGAPRYRGPASDHFDGRRFRNQDEGPHGRLAELLKWGLSRKRGRWAWRDAEPGSPPPERVGGGDLRVTLVNHATFLVQVDRMNVLTDPIWAGRTSPVSFAGPKRFRPPGLRFEDLPPIDLVLLSHNHYDHLCAPTMRRLAREHAPTVVSGLGNARLLQAMGVSEAVDLDWWGVHAVTDRVSVVATPARHFSGRGLRDRDGTLWCGLALETPSGTVFFAGDTGMGMHFEQIRERLGSPRLALLPIGAVRPEWFMRPVHMTPEDAIEAHHMLGAGTSVATHYGTFALADDAQDEPIERLRAALDDECRERFLVLEHGVGKLIAPHEEAGTSAAAE